MDLDEDRRISRFFKLIQKHVRKCLQRSVLSANIKEQFYINEFVSGFHQQEEVDCMRGNIVCSSFVRCIGSNEVHFWLNGYVNKQNCHIWSEANPQVYVETPLHPEKLTVWCALWAGGILLQKRRRPQRYSQW
ncbi:hypothetical protein TNCV_3431451 [Trichonephila clavipes]|nr:hypothetical protein TNCV_3431451 [Trichonephila clavipes]